MGPGARAFVVSLLAFLVFGVVLAAWHVDEDDGRGLQESVADGGGNATAANESGDLSETEDGSGTAGNETVDEGLDSASANATA